MITHPSLISFISFFYHSHSIHIPFHPFTFSLILPFLITLACQHSFSFHSTLYLFRAIVHSIFTLFIIELVMDEVRTIPCIHSFTIHPHPSLSLHSSFLQPYDIIHFLFIPFHHTHSRIISLHSSYTLHYHFHYHLTISHSSL